MERRAVRAVVLKHKLQMNVHDILARLGTEGGSEREREREKEREKERDFIDIQEVTQGR